MGRAQAISATRDGFFRGVRAQIYEKKTKKKPARGGQITGFYRGITQGHHTTFDGFKISNPVYGFVIAR